MQLPIGSESSFLGVIDLVEMDAVYWEDKEGREPIKREIPADMLECRKSSCTMFEKAAELDDVLIEKFLDGDEISNSRIKSQFTPTVLTSKTTLVFCGSSLKK